MKKVYYLSTCDTCKRILKEVNLPSDFVKQDVKKEALTEVEVEELYALSKSYESLFNKRAKLYKERDLKNKSLSEEDYKNLLLEQYTFLKRPVFVIEDKIFIGNSKKTVEELKNHLNA
ncbi:arsenate reductase family protein [Mesonia ostreae]|uniref:ArsC/Spx/MgsR family protein n=1 Tax=Mesonia ostreae TaxID=861110 RepID=A0ABU2KIN4_9FLAO|nr:ArsC/Spx/MgsR family protein [Mesonia ostreae]MDT0294518.1 ArsC/Spx/MgsR family protein [Mesonia ostreae]